MNFGDRMALVARVLPYVARRPAFALKGGTALNLFFRELPRLSVDIDLVFLPITPYHEARQSIFRQLNKIAADIRSKKVSECQIVAPGHASERLLSIQFRHRGKQIKVEVNPVARARCGLQRYGAARTRRSYDSATWRIGSPPLKTSTRRKSVLRLADSISATSSISKNYLRTRGLIGSCLELFWCI